MFLIDRLIDWLIWFLGALQGLSELLHLDQLAHGSLCNETQCTTLRRYASMTLTNLTFGHGPNKTLLCSIRLLLFVLSHQLASPNDDLRQVTHHYLSETWIWMINHLWIRENTGAVWLSLIGCWFVILKVTASVLRNLSWRADSSSKEALQEANVVRSLITVAMETHRESTLKSMLSALWNLSAHSSLNKADICSTEGSLQFLVQTLTYQSESKTLSVIESGGGILRNISSHIATCDDYRSLNVLTKYNCAVVLINLFRCRCGEQSYAATPRLFTDHAAPPELGQSDGGEQRLRYAVEPVGSLQGRPDDAARSRRYPHAAKSGPLASQDDRHGLIGRSQESRLFRRSWSFTG